MKTLCCKSTYTRKSRLHYICDKCKNDVTMEIVYAALAIADLKTGEKETKLNNRL